MSILEGVDLYGLRQVLTPNSVFESISLRTVRVLRGTVGEIRVSILGKRRIR